MKNLSLISFVGVDAKTNFNDLIKLNDDVCEFSVLFSESKSTIRYPDHKFCHKFLDWGTQNARCTSIHLCGEEAINGYLNQKDDIMSLCHLAYRIQLNINIAKYPNHEELSERILKTACAHNHRIILQQNKTKEKFTKCFIDKKNSETFNRCVVDLLHDSSGGFGREISSVVAPDPKYYTGYAGGINPENVVKIVDLIESTNSSHQTYYIDMESGVRVDNIFSIDKCRQVIKNLGL